MIKLSKIQLRTLEKLTENYQSSYELQEKLNTLHSLVDKKLAKVIYLQGHMLMPYNQIKFKKV